MKNVVSLNKYFVKPLLLRNFYRKSVRLNFHKAKYSNECLNDAHFLSKLIINEKPTFSSNLTLSVTMLVVFVSRKFHSNCHGKIPIHFVLSRNFLQLFSRIFFLVRVKFPKLFRNIQAFFAWDGSAPIEKDLSKIKHLVQLKTIKRNFCPSDSNLLYFNFLSVTLFSQYGDNSFSTLFHKSHFLTIPGQWHFTEFLQNLVKLYA